MIMPARSVAEAKIETFAGVCFDVECVGCVSVLDVYAPLCPPHVIVCAKQTPASLVIEGGTVVSAGLNMAFDTARSMRSSGTPDRICRVVLLSDMSR